MLVTVTCPEPAYDNHGDAITPHHKAGNMERMDEGYFKGLYSHCLATYGD